MGRKSELYSRYCTFIFTCGDSLQTCSPTCGAGETRKAFRVDSVGAVPAACYLHIFMQASLGAQPGTGLTAPSVSVTMQEQSIRPRLGSSTATSLVLPSGVVAPPPPPPGFPARLPPRPLVPTASLSRAPVPVPTPSPLSRPVTYNVPTDTLRARSPPFPMAMSSGATVSSAGPSPPSAMPGPFGPPQAATLAPAMPGPFGPPQASTLV